MIHMSLLNYTTLNEQAQQAVRTIKNVLHKDHYRTFACFCSAELLSDTNIYSAVRDRTVGGLISLHISPSAPNLLNSTLLNWALLPSTASSSVRFRDSYMSPLTSETWTIEMQWWIRTGKHCGLITGKVHSLLSDTMNCNTAWTVNDREPPYLSPVDRRTSLQANEI